jgi:hypothetical protein
MFAAHVLFSYRWPIAISMYCCAILILQTMKNTLLRAFTASDMPELVKTSSRPDWAAVLHNICFLHGALRLRASLAGRSGWNIPDKLADIGFTELTVCISYLVVSTSV